MRISDWSSDVCSSDRPSDDTPALLDLLEAHGAKATFFLVGERAAARPDLVRGIAARGHGIGNHSHGHPQAWFWALGPARMRREIMQCQEVLRAITGRAPRWFRAVVGHANPFVSAPLRDCGLARVAGDARAFRSEEHTPEIQSLMRNSYVVFGWKKKTDKR